MNSLFLLFNKAGRKEAVLLIVCVLVGIGLRLYTFDTKSLWIDEIHTFNDSRYDLKAQLRFYEQNPTYLQAPFFFVFTHVFYPFSKPERDLRIIPVLFGILSIPLFYSLSRLFSPPIALPCALSLSLMTYHVSISQDGRSYALLMFLGMAGLWFFMKYLKTLREPLLIPGAFFFAVLFYTSYSSISFMIFSQFLWFYQIAKEKKSPPFVPALIFNGLILVFCLPWIIFLALHYSGQWMSQPFELKADISLWGILYGLFHDWAPYPPLMISSAVILTLAPLLSKERRNHLLLLSAVFVPVIGLFLFCKVIRITHFLSSRYLVNFLPLFLISLYLSVHHIELKLAIHRKLLRPTSLLLLLFIATNLVILPLYYQSEKQDFRRMGAYLKANLKDGDKIFDANRVLIGILHYLRIPPDGRYYILDESEVSANRVNYRKSFKLQDKAITIYHSNICCDEYMKDGNRLWIVAGSINAKRFKESTPSILKGYFDGSFLNLERFPMDSSMYLLLWDPKSPNEKGIDLPIQ